MPIKHLGLDITFFVIEGFLYDFINEFELKLYDCTSVKDFDNKRDFLKITNLHYKIQFRWEKFVFQKE